MRDADADGPLRECKLAPDHDDYDQLVPRSSNFACARKAAVASAISHSVANTRNRCQHRRRRMATAGKSGACCSNADAVCGRPCRLAPSRYTGYQHSSAHSHLHNRCGAWATNTLSCSSQARSGRARRHSTTCEVKSCRWWCKSCSPGLRAECVPCSAWSGRNTAEASSSCVIETCQAQACEVEFDSPGACSKAGLQGVVSGTSRADEGVQTRPAEVINGEGRWVWSSSFSMVCQSTRGPYLGFRSR